jgi:hypothetical protein
MKTGYRHAFETTNQFYRSSFEEGQLAATFACALHCEIAIEGERARSLEICGRTCGIRYVQSIFALKAKAKRPAIFRPRDESYLV